ncbi:hypothetical protein KCP71_11600 [Salmonella enterica subsp. enterica]|nr:hypothetical protein KCP71_11600 [Salmonella enterica subsp. enterica]
MVTPTKLPPKADIAGNGVMIPVTAVAPSCSAPCRGASGKNRCGVNGKLLRHGRSALPR